MGARPRRLILSRSDPLLFQERSVSSGSVFFACSYHSRSTSDRQFRKGPTYRRRCRSEEDHEAFQYTRVSKEDLPRTEAFETYPT